MILEKQRTLSYSRFVIYTSLILSIFSTNLYSFDFKLPKIDLSNLDDRTYYGFALGQSFLDIGADDFNVNGQDISINLDDSDLFLSLFFVVPLNENIGVDFSLSQVGNFSFSGQVDGTQNVGTVSGEQKYIGLSTSAYYERPFEKFDARAHLGFTQLRLETEGTINLIGKSEQSLNYSENSTNLYISLEGSRKVYKDWELGPALSIIDAGDRIMTFAITLRRESNN